MSSSKWSVSDLKKQVFAVQKNSKTNVWNLDFGEKWQISFFEKCVLAPQVFNFFSGVIQKMLKEKNLQVGQS